MLDLIARYWPGLNHPRARAIATYVKLPYSERRGLNNDSQKHNKERRANGNEAASCGQTTD